MLPEQRQRVQHQVVEVHRVLALERRRERIHQLGGDLGEPVEASRGRELITGHHLVLGGRDNCLHGAGRKQLGGDIPLFQQPANQRQAVVFVEDGELARKPQPFGLAAEQPRREAVEGADPEAGGIARQQGRDPMFHLGSGLVGERHRKDPFRRHPVLIHQHRDAGGQHPGLARTRSGPDTWATASRCSGLRVRAQSRPAGPAVISAGRRRRRRPGRRGFAPIHRRTGCSPAARRWSARRRRRTR